MSDLEPTLFVDPAHAKWSMPEAEALIALETRPLLVVMHGYGSHEGDLISLSPLLPENFVVVSPRAPLEAPAPIENGFSWFPILVPGQLDPNRINRAALAMLDFLDRLDARVSGGLGEIALMGFSQGGAMATTMLRHRPERFAAAVNCSGFVADAPLPGDAALATRRPPVFWGRDEADPIIAPHVTAVTERWLPVHSSLTERLYPGMLHSISREEIEDIHEFLSAHVPGATR